MKKILKISCLGVFILPFFAFAGAMAVSINDLYLQNNTSSSKTITIANLAESANQFQIPSKGTCKVNQPIMFQPFQAESNNFVIMISNENNFNPIVIDKFGLITLAADSTLGLSYSGKVKGYSLFGFCNNKLAQYKFLNVSAHDNLESMPNFNLNNCQGTSNFVYLINDSYIKVKHRVKVINFNKVAECKSANN